MIAPKGDVLATGSPPGPGMYHDPPLLAVPVAALALYALAANRARALLRSTRAMRLVNRAAGGLMASAALAIATR